MSEDLWAKWFGNCTQEFVLRMVAEDQQPLAEFADNYVEDMWGSWKEDFMTDPEEMEEDAKRRAKNEVAWLLVEANRETKEEGRA